ncbi:response regulator transcription factor [Paenibacillus sinopodophylli]|uniref:response regulator transcription factor n=1 Tax=Paenibacillus sinopodophylli TaxID=1837342 RepID=UPI00110CAF54|nr:response regulator [Paenibacillus sinopodophylli]
MRIILVDDEPIFIEELKHLIRQFNNDHPEIPLQVIHEFYNAQKAIEQIPALLPDIVFTDIQMLGVDGLQLARTIQQRWPAIKVVLVSGHSTFDYAREAMRSNVTDYLLKPLSNEIFNQTILNLYKQQKQKATLRSQEIMKRMLLSEHPLEIPTEIKKMIFPYEQYVLILISQNQSSIDIDFMFPQTQDPTELYLDSIRPFVSAPDELWAFATKSGKEIAVLIAGYELPRKLLDKIMAHTQTYFYNADEPVTIVYSERFQMIEKLKAFYVLLNERLYGSIVIGKHQLIRAAETSNTVRPFAVLLTVSDEYKLVSYLSNKDWSSIKRYILQIFQIAEKEQTPSIYIEKYLKRILHLIENQSPVPDINVLKKLELRVEELVYTTPTFQEAAEAYWNFIVHTWNPETKNNRREDLYQQIETYMKTNMREPLSIQDLTTIFQISNTNLWNLFRDYSGKSFVELLTTLRMNKAKELIDTYPSMLLKDIAEFVGYRDQHYFSRVFKTVVGLTPSEYRNPEDRA